MNFKRPHSLAHFAGNSAFFDSCKTQSRHRRILPKAVIFAMLFASLTAFTSTAAAQEGMFVPTGSVNSANNFPTPILLNDGKVLVLERSNTGSSFEVYDPATGIFTHMDSDNTDVWIFATLLNNGTVLLGGARFGVYDPATGTVTPTGNMITSRYYGFTTTLLKNGMVLVTGGVTTPPVHHLASAELYDPATGTFTVTGNMTTARFGSTATLLKDGKVLIAGGLIDHDGDFYDPDALSSAELFDPITGTFTATGSMISVRSDLTATLLNNGKVLIAGGSSGLDGDFIPLASAEVYDPATGTFTSTGSMNNVRADHSATLLNNGKVLVAGGFVDFYFTVTAGAELYDPATGIFTAAGSMSTARDEHTATLLNNGTVLVTGGQYNTNSADLYVPFSIFPMSVSFPNPPVGTTSESQTVTLQNSASTVLNITSVGISGTNASDFAETDNCLGIVPAGGSCSFFVTFTPAVTGSRSGTLSIANNLTGIPLPIPLTGTGIAATRIALSASSLSFTNLLVGTSSPVQGLTFSNAGNAPLIISQLAISGTADFVENDNCGGSVSPGATCTINVTFFPKGSGLRTGILIVTDNATSPQSPQLIALSGTATDFSLGGVIGGSTSATVTAGQTAKYNLQLSPLGGFAGSTTLACSAAAPVLATCTVTPATLTVSGTSPVSFQVSVTTTGRSSVPPGVFRSPWQHLPQRLIFSETFLLLLLLATSGLFTARRSRTARPWIGAAILLISVATLLTACSGSGSSRAPVSVGTSVGTYTFTVTGMQAGSSRFLDLTLVVQ